MKKIRLESNKFLEELQAENPIPVDVEETPIILAQEEIINIQENPIFVEEL